jgi:hypothetical protein
MTQLYSRNNEWPQELPFRVTLADGSTRTDPSTFTAQELTAWGYNGPLTPPEYDAYTQVLEWTSGAFSVRPMTGEEIAARIRANANYIAFWDALIASTVYASIRAQSMASLPMNTLATEFIALIGDAKAGRANEAAIQASMSAVFATGTFTEADAAKFTAALAAGSLTDIYSLT